MILSEAVIGLIGVSILTAIFWAYLNWVDSKSQNNQNKFKFGEVSRKFLELINYN